jgi:hypothetical protein
MIYHLNPAQYYTNRTYLTQWFDKDTLVITDNDFQNQTETQALLNTHPLKNRVLDNTHNPYPDNKVEIKINPTLTNNFEYWYHPEPGTHFFPLFLWMFSLRNNLWWQGFSMDSGNNKTQGIMCLNHKPRLHRIRLFKEFQRKNLLDSMMYTFPGYRNLPGEVPEIDRADAGVDHEVYDQYAVNIVTETVTDLCYISEKTCKPFISRQIPIIVSSVGVNQFLKDIGLDMFEDIVPWATWDSESDENIRINKIVGFVEQWIKSGTVLEDYHRVIDRVERNKKYFHSEKFRDIIMVQMSF